MLNLSQIKFQVKTADIALIPNPNSPLGTGLAYRQLKEAGWVCHDPADRQGMEVHPTERVPVFRLGTASIRRNKAGESHWLIEVDGQTFPASESVAEITAAVKSKLATLRVNPEPEIENPKSKIQNSSIAAQIAYALTLEYPEHAKRIGLALELVEASKLTWEYKTTYDPATFHGHYECNCPDSTHRRPRARFGAACKHVFAREIARLAEAERKSVAYRKLNDSIERQRARIKATQPGYDLALRPDPLNQKRDHYNEHGQWNAHGK